MGNLLKVMPLVRMHIAQFNAWPLGNTQEDIDIDIIASMTEGEILNSHFYKVPLVFIKSPPIVILLKEL